MKYLNVCLAFIGLLSASCTLANCDLSAVDSLEAPESISLLNNCTEIENDYVFHIKLGDSYLRNNDLAMAILNYEKARKYCSSDDILNTNLAYAYSKTKNGAKTLMISEIQSAKHAIASPHLRDYWAVVSIFLVLTSLFMLFKGGSLNKRIASKLKPLFFGVTLVFLGITMYTLALEKKEAIVMIDEVSVHESTSGTTDAISVLNSGYKLNIIEVSGDWAKVILATNQQVWVKRDSLELI